MIEEEIIQALEKEIKEFTNEDWKPCYMEMPIGDYQQIIDEMQGLLDLYNKQKEEIEELKKPKFIINAETVEVTKIHNDYISKDKIRDKIKNLEKSKEFNEVITIKFRQHGFEDGVNIKFLIDIMIDILKSLL